MPSLKLDDEEQQLLDDFESGELVSDGVTNQEKVNSMTALEAKLMERLKRLPPNRVAEVVDFVEFLSQREERAAAAQRLGEKLARLDALGLAEVSEGEVEAEIQTARQERHERQAEQERRTGQGA